MEGGVGLLRPRQLLPGDHQQGFLIDAGCVAMRPVADLSGLIAADPAALAAVRGFTAASCGAGYRVAGSILL